MNTNDKKNTDNEAVREIIGCIKNQAKPVSDLTDARKTIDAYTPQRGYNIIAEEIRNNKDMSFAEKRDALEKNDLHYQEAVSRSSQIYITLEKNRVDHNRALLKSILGFTAFIFTSAMVIPDSRKAILSLGGKMLNA